MYHNNIKKITKENTNFRKVIYTGEHSQLVLMNLKVGEVIGEESHKTVDQMFIIVAGEGIAVVGEKTFSIDEHDVLVIPAGTKHNLINQGDEDLKLYTVYSPPVHADGIMQKQANPSQHLNQENNGEK